MIVAGSTAVQRGLDPAGPATPTRRESSLFLLAGGWSADEDRAADVDRLMAAMTSGWQRPAPLTATPAAELDPVDVTGYVGLLDGPENSPGDAAAATGPASRPAAPRGPTTSPYAASMPAEGLPALT